MRDPNKKAELTASISIKVEAYVAESLKVMATHMKISEDEITNTALRRYIATHSDFFPPRSAKKESSWAMSIKSDRWITKMSLEHKMIEPFEARQVRAGMISYGVSSYGYDCRVADEYKIFTNINNTLVDPKNFTADNFVTMTGDHVIIPPNSFVLAKTVEYFRIPRNCLVVCIGKSTYARCGLIVNVTPLEPEWEGILTLEISNTTPLPAKVYSNEGIAQLMFFESDEQCEISYKDKKGKYQAQSGLTLPRL